MASKPADNQKNHWAETQTFCENLAKSGMPLDAKWPALVLQLRGVDLDPSLSAEQKARLQRVLIDLLGGKVFSDEKYAECRNKVYEILTAPVTRKLERITIEVSEITKEAGRLFGKHTQEVRKVADTVDQQIADGVEPEKVLLNLRNTLKDVVARIDEDTAVFKQLSYKDGLTGLPNRRRFDDYIVETVNYWITESRQAALIIFDVDHFKSFNDGYGHLVGDQILVALAEYVSAVTRSLGEKNEDVLPARFGGDEFVIVLRGRLAASAVLIAEKIRYGIGNAALVVKDVDGNVLASGLHATISMGIAHLQAGWDDCVASLIEYSDKALYTAKKHGRDCVVLYEPESKPNFRIQKKTQK